MNSWLAPGVAEAQRALADEQLQQDPLPIQFRALADAVRFTRCPGDIWEVGCASGYNREALDRQGVAYRSYGGNDISPAALAVARERYPESMWCERDWPVRMTADVVIDGCALMHADDWQVHLSDLCARSRRWVTLHRVPTHQDPTCRSATCAYGQEFGAWQFNSGDLSGAMSTHGFELQGAIPADGGSWTAIYARPRIYCTYADSAYLGRLKSLYASMVRHCGPFELHVLAWDDGVVDWCAGAGVPNCTGVEEDGDFPGPPRTQVEKMWTIGPAWIADVMKRTGQPVTYVDADVMFHSSPEPVFAEIGGAPAAVFPHNFARAEQGLPGPTVESHGMFGRYNVGVVYIADPSIAVEWAGQCRVWCYDKVAGECYGDQGYLNWWPKVHGAHVVQHPGANLGPWAIHTRALDVRNGVPYFGGRPLVAYHYSAYKELPEGRVAYTRPEYLVIERQGEIVYLPYLKEMEKQKR